MTSTEDLLSLWEQGQGLSPLERTDFLARVGASILSERDTEPPPIGTDAGRILELRKQLFGAELVGLAVCPECGATLEARANVDQFLAAPRAFAGMQELVVEGATVRFRLPTLRDLRALDPQDVLEDAAKALLSRCLEDPRQLGSGAVAEAVLAQMADRDPLADPTLALVCGGCDAASSHPLDAASFLWREVEAWAARLLADVHTIARAYAWSQAEILSMNPARRQVYLDLIGG